MKNHPFIRDKIFISYKISLFLHIPSLFFVHFCLLIKSVEWMADHMHVVRDPLINGGALSICLNEVDAFLYDIPSADTAGRRITRAACQAALFLHAADVTHRWIVQDVSHGEKEVALNGTLNGYSSVFWRVCWELLSSPTCRFALTLTHPPTHSPPRRSGMGKHLQLFLLTFVTPPPPPCSAFITPSLISGCRLPPPLLSSPHPPPPRASSPSIVVSVKTCDSPPPPLPPPLLSSAINPPPLPLPSASLRYNRPCSSVRL